MIRENQRLFNRLNVISDGVIIYTMLPLAFWLRFYVLPGGVITKPLVSYLRIGLAITLIQVFIVNDINFCAFPPAVRAGKLSGKRENYCRLLYLWVLRTVRVPTEGEAEKRACTAVAGKQPGSGDAVRLAVLGSRGALLYRLGREVEMIPGIGVDFAALEKDAGGETSVSRKSLGIARDAFVLIYPAEFSARKSQSVLIRAMTYLPEDTVLVLCGDGSELDKCRALAGELKLDKRVLFPGRVEHMAAWYALADAAVTASRSEGLPFNVMEAMYCGLPVVASRSRDIRTSSTMGSPACCMTMATPNSARRRYVSCWMRQCCGIVWPRTPGRAQRSMT